MYLLFFVLTAVCLFNSGQFVKPRYQTDLVRLRSLYNKSFGQRRRRTVANAHIWGRKKVSRSDRRCVCSNTRFREAVKPVAFGGTLSREVFVWILC